MWRWRTDMIADWLKRNLAAAGTWTYPKLRFYILAMKTTARAVLLLLTFFPVLQPANAVAADDPALLTLARIYADEEFKTTPPIMSWLDGEAAYVTLEESATSDDGNDLVQHDAATGQTEILVTAEELIPTGGSKPLEVEAFTWSRDKSLLLVYTNSQRVWR